MLASVREKGARLSPPRRQCKRKKPARITAHSDAPRPTRAATYAQSRACPATAGGIGIGIDMSWTYAQSQSVAMTASARRGPLPAATDIPSSSACRRRSNAEVPARKAPPLFLFLCDDVCRNDKNPSPLRAASTSHARPPKAESETASLSASASGRASSNGRNLCTCSPHAREEYG